jgi:hypothetical protein
MSQNPRCVNPGLNDTRILFTRMYHRREQMKKWKKKTEENRKIRNRGGKKKKVEHEEKIKTKKYFLPSFP